MHTITKLLITSALATSLSGCLVAAAGAGAGAVYVKDHYNISVKKKNESSNTK